MPARSTPPPTPSAKQHLLGAVMLQATVVTNAETEQERLIIRAYKGGCSLRDLATAAGYGSHHRVQELLVRRKVVRASSRADTST